MTPIYLDNASTTPIIPQVWDKICSLQEKFGNPSSTHKIGRESKIILEQARERVAKNMNCSVSEVFFTSGGTESNNIVLSSARQLGIKRIISSPIEHHSVLNSLKKIEQENKLFLPENRIEIVFLDVDTSADICLDDLENILKSEDKKTLVSLMHANNELGRLYGIKKIAKLCHSYNALFHTDAVQTVGHYDIDLQAVDVDFLSASGHKFGALKGSGFLYIKASKNKLTPLIVGGEQERALRAGTENLLGIYSLSEALDFSITNLQREQNYVYELKKLFVSQIKKIEGVFINANSDREEHFLYSMINVALPVKMSAQMLVFSLDIKGVCVSGGSACMSGAFVDSEVVKKVSTHNMPSIRVSIGRQNVKEDIIFAIESIKEILLASQ